MKNNIIYAVVVLISGFLRAAEPEQEPEQWQRDIVQEIAVLKPSLVEHHKDISSAKLDELLNSLSATTWRGPRESLAIFYESGDSTVVELALKNPILTQQAAEYLKDIGTQENLPALCEALLREMDSPLMGSANVVRDIQDKEAIVITIKKITSLPFSGIDIKRRKRADINRIVDETRKWLAVTSKPLSSGADNHTPSAIDENKNAPLSGNVENRLPSPSASSSVTPNTNLAKMVREPNTAEKIKQTPITSTATFPAILLAIVGIGVIALIIVLGRKNSGE